MLFLLYPTAVTYALDPAAFTAFTDIRTHVYAAEVDVIFPLVTFVAYTFTAVASVYALVAVVALPEEFRYVNVLFTANHGPELDVAASKKTL
jgi:hypothetical protein